MDTHTEIVEFLSQFDTNSYNREQIGNNKQLIIKLYEYITKLNIDEDNTQIIINNIAYLKKDTINIPIFLELFSKSLSYLDSYNISELITVVRQLHNIYNESANPITLDEYIHLTDEEKTRKLFLTLNNKYLNRHFTSDDILQYVGDLKFALAIELSNKEYQDFINYIDNFESFQNTYSPLIMYKTYNTVRNNLKGLTKLFWDLLFGNEYMVALVRHNLSIDDIHNKRSYSNKNKTKKEFDNFNTLQLDLFSLEEEPNEVEIDIKDVKKFQISNVFNVNLLKGLETEKEMVSHYLELIKYKKENIVLPKLKSKSNYLYQ